MDHLHRLQAGSLKAHYPPFKLMSIGFKSQYLKELEKSESQIQYNTKRFHHWYPFFMENSNVKYMCGDVRTSLISSMTCLAMSLVLPYYPMQSHVVPCILPMLWLVPAQEQREAGLYSGQLCPLLRLTGRSPVSVSSSVTHDCWESQCAKVKLPQNSKPKPKYPFFCPAKYR